MIWIIVLMLGVRVGSFPQQPTAPHVKVGMGHAGGWVTSRRPIAEER